MFPDMDPELAAVFARNLRAAIEAAGANQNRLAKQIGMTRGGIGRLYHGQALPSAEALVRIAKALGVTTDRLLGVERRQKTSN